MTPARPSQQDDLFTTETAGLPEVLGPDVTRLDDQELIRRARTGDADAFDAVAAGRIPVAYRLA